MNKTKLPVIALVASLLAAFLCIGIWLSVTLQKNKISDETGIFNQLIFVISKYENDNGFIPTTVDSVTALLDDSKSKKSLIPYAKLLLIDPSGDFIKMRGMYGEYAWYPKEQRYVFTANKGKAEKVPGL
ncbi:MAG: hypothetical protein M0Q93_11860 [Terrimicrobiaceae bacterium]|jgi:hypothetical protein|nr:hypothetical protein [Terrimicrobiaceae bacterium]